MSPNHKDYAILDKLDLERKPVGVKFLPVKPDGIMRLEKDLNFCEMLKEAQENIPFYAGREDFHCIEPLLLGMEDPDPIFISGLFGADLGVFKDTNAARKIYQYLPPQPARIHGFVYLCQPEEVRDFSTNFDFLNILINASLPSPTEELIAATLRQMSLVQEDSHAFLVAGGKELASLLSSDFIKLKNILGRLK